MSFVIGTLNFQNTGDVGTDVAVNMSELDPAVVDAARISLDASDQETTGFVDYGYGQEKIYFAASDSKTRRMIDLVSDSTNYVRAQASPVNFEETSTNFSDLFGTTVFEDRVLNDNSFLERVVHSENGFDEVFTNSSLYGAVGPDLTKRSILLSSPFAGSNGWSVDSSKLWTDLNITSSPASTFTEGFRNDRFYFET